MIYLRLNSKTANAKKHCDCIFTRLQLEKEDVRLKLVDLAMKDKIVSQVM